MEAPRRLAGAIAALLVLPLVPAFPAAELPGEGPRPPAKPEASPGGRFEAARFGAKGDGRTDDARGIQAALDAAAAAGGGVVDLGAGQFRLDAGLTVPSGVTLSGVWQAPHFSTPAAGTTLLAFAGRGKEKGPPLIALRSNAAVQGITVHYPEQTVSDLKPYPWTIQGEGTHPSVSEVTLLNPWKGIDFGSRSNEMHYIRNVYGCPLSTGVYLDRCTDIGRVENVHFNPNSWTRSGVPTSPKGAEGQKLVEFLQKNLVAFEIGRSDWEFMVNTFSWGSKVGYRFFKSADGPTNGNFLGIAADWAVVPLLVEDAQAPGLLITNGEFVGSPACEAVVKVAASNTGAVQLSNSSFWGPHHRIVLAEGKGTVSLFQCNFVQWDPAGKGLPAVEVLGGSLILQGSIFNQDKLQVRLGPEVKSAVVMGNQFRGKARIENQSRGEVQVLGNVSRGK